jgi:hypothetical protein
MAIGVQRVHGSSQSVQNVGTVTLNSNAVIINTGINSPIQAYKIGTLGATANLAAELGNPSPAGVAGAVDTLLRVVSRNATVLAFQVDASGASAQLSVITERSGWSDSDLQTEVRALGGNIGSFGNVFPALATVSSTGGLKLA